MKLTSLDGEHAGFSVGVERVTVGAAADCAVRIEQSDVAQAHCRLQKVGNSLMVQDLSSGRPTAINGEPIKRATADVGDVIDIGPFSFRVDPADETAESTTETVVPVGHPDSTVDAESPLPPARPKRKRRKRRSSEDVAFDALLADTPPQQATASRAVVPQVVAGSDSPPPPVNAMQETQSSSPIGAEPLSASVVPPAAAVDGPTSSRASARKLSLPSFGALGGVVRQNVKAFVIILVCLVILATWNIPWHQFGETSEAQMLAVCQNFVTRHEELSSADATEAEWDTLQTEFEVTAAPFLPELERTGSALRPVRRELLFLVRDFIPELIHARSEVDPDLNKELTDCIRGIEAMLQGQAPELEDDAIVGEVGP